MCMSMCRGGDAEAGMHVLCHARRTVLGQVCPRRPVLPFRGGAVGPGERPMVAWAHSPRGVCRWELERRFIRGERGQRRGQADREGRRPKVRAGEGWRGCWRAALSLMGEGIGALGVGVGLVVRGGLSR
jgi:hypothetical protein